MIEALLVGAGKCVNIADLARVDDGAAGNDLFYGRTAQIVCQLG